MALLVILTWYVAVPPALTEAGPETVDDKLLAALAVETAENATPTVTINVARKRFLIRLKGRKWGFRINGWIKATRKGLDIAQYLHKVKYIFYYTFHSEGIHNFHLKPRIK